ncbi:MAG: sigma-54 dependent transcriptional regulator [Desulfobacteraceae bacterium]
MNKIMPIIGVSESMLKVKELISHVADTCLNILVTGETGVGKELVAQNLHTLSPRHDKAFVKVNCAALPETLLESELYGYEKGAFTGAHKNKQGKFQAANNGVLFLDEIGDMTFSLQSKMLHVLQTGEFSPLGSEREFKTNAWIIAATNHNLEEKIARKEFREDLFYRLNIIKIEVPPLRERPEDIPSLIEHYLKTYSAEYPGSRLQRPERKIMQKLTDYQWPGNIRELQNAIKKQLILNDWEKVLAELNHMSRKNSNSVESSAANPGPDSSVTSLMPILSEFINLPTTSGNMFEDISLKQIKKEVYDKVEKEVITYVLNQTGWNRSKAARILKVSYKTLLYKLKELEIVPSSGM